MVAAARVMQKQQKSEDYLDIYFQSGLVGCALHYFDKRSKNKSLKKYRLLQTDLHLIQRMQASVETKLQQYANDPAMSGAKEFREQADRFAIVLFAAQKHLKTTKDKKPRTIVNMYYDNTIALSSFFKIEFVDTVTNDVVMTGNIHGLR